MLVFDLNGKCLEKRANVLFVMVELAKTRLNRKTQLEIIEIDLQLIFVLYSMCGGHLSICFLFLPALSQSFENRMSFLSRSRSFNSDFDPNIGLSFAHNSLHVISFISLTLFSVSFFFHGSTPTPIINT